MKFTEYCDAINVNIIITRYANQNERWCARLEHCEVAKGGCLSSAHGNGNTPQAAILDYISQIEGTRVVFNAMNKEIRREFTVPMGMLL